jgi:hypothetical protein
MQDLVFPAHMKLVELLEGATVLVENEQLNLTVDGTLDTRKFNRIDALPANCTSPDPDAATPREVVEAIWTAMDEHYAFFDLHGVDWATRKAFIPAANAQMTDQELTDLILEMMDGIDDGHVHFGTDEIGYSSPSIKPAWIPDDGSITWASLIENALINADTDLTQAENAPIIYGLRPDGIGYIMVRQMDVDKTLGGNSTDTMAAAFETVLLDMTDATALIIDVRFNPGGSDTVSFGIAGHFIDEPQPVFTKTTRSGADQVNLFTGIVQPFDETAETRPTMVLTSRLTGSAAEIFTMAMRDFPQVTTLGEPTSGGLSDVMGIKLPNGWGLGLSDQIYLTMDGSLFEGTGIPPDMPVVYETAPFQSGEDPILAAAIAHLSGQ